MFCQFIWTFLPLSIYHLHHIQKLYLGKYPFLHKQSAKSLLLDHLGHEEFFKGTNLFRIKAECYRTSLKIYHQFVFHFPPFSAISIKSRVEIILNFFRRL